jgi:transcriptional regulator with XRE-family HTH domain
MDIQKVSHVMIQKAARKSSSLSVRILQALLDRGMSQSRIASELGVNRSHISRVKSGEHEWSDLQLERIERITRTPLGLLILGAAPPEGADKEVLRVHQEAKELLMTSANIRENLRGAGSTMRKRRRAI